MKVLLITFEIWNDLVYGNNVLQNWFTGMKDVEFAQICMSPGQPYNTLCHKYFQVTDIEIVRSIFGKKAGQSRIISFNEMKENPQSVSYKISSSFYSFMKKISGTWLRLTRDLLWELGRYDEKALEEFIREFNPDVVFCPRLLSWAQMRLEKIVSKYTKAPFVAFTGDAEASFRQFSFSPLFWMNTVCFNWALKRHCKLYDHYFMHSLDQAKEYKAKYGVNTSTLFKCGDFNATLNKKNVGTPITIVYAGRLYCNRWKSLAQIGEALKIINKDSVKIILNIYTQDKISSKQESALSRDKYIFLKGSVLPEELVEIYHNADIALHVESLDQKYKLRTRVSFSTKIIDLMASTCAIMAICWDEHTGYKYLKNNDAAFCISSYEEILPTLQRIADNPKLIQIYAEKAYDCGKNNHSREKIQNQIKDVFSDVIMHNKKDNNPND